MLWAGVPRKQLTLGVTQPCRNRTLGHWRAGLRLSCSPPPLCTCKLIPSSPKAGVTLTLTCCSSGVPRVEWPGSASVEISTNWEALINVCFYDVQRMHLLNNLMQ